MIYKDLDLVINSSCKEIFKSNYLIITKTRNGTQNTKIIFEKGKIK